MKDFKKYLADARYEAWYQGRDPDVLDKECLHEGTPAEDCVREQLRPKDDD